ncbi:DUF3955 domain-containing protein [Lysinibacillus sp. NPDC059133]|uniref:DUF3955 domain-containing protein n=1 Tax=Lysinibacillus sp. NPDC059133 TaxID=3346737 RepID=UPI0036A0AB09
MKNKYFLASTPLILGIISLITYIMVGTKVEPDGTLREPFYLLPFGGLLVLTGIVLILFIGITSMLKKQNN